MLMIYCAVGEIPTRIHELGNLRVLSLPHNDIFGMIPSTIDGLVQLEELNLSGNLIHGWSSYPQLSLTIHLMILWYSLGSIPECIGNLEKLRILNLSLNHLTDEIPESIGKLSSLTDLLIKCNYLTGKMQLLIL
jgi:Leucine-rich repeat (LRR) protein